MASDPESEASSIMEQLLRDGGGRGAGFFPILVALMGRPPAEGEAAPPPPDRIVLVNPLTQGMVVLHGNAALMSEILFEGGGRDGPPPASKASIEALREVGDGEGEVDGECPVCLDGIGGGGGGDPLQAVKEMPCKHRFHGGCIEKWLGMHGSCPVCRFQMPVEEAAVSSKSGGGEGEERGGEAVVGEETRTVRRRREVWISISMGRQGRRDLDDGGNGGGAGEVD